MTGSKPYLSWPGTEDRIVVEEMLNDRNSGQWHDCREFVKRLVQKQAYNIYKDFWEDIVQETMIRLDKSLATFQYHCAFKTWIFNIVRSCIIDVYRKSRRIEQYQAPLSDLHDDVEHDSDAFSMHITETIEDECILHDELHKAIVALQEYLSIHANPIRNGQILNMVIFEGHSLEEAAQAVGCSSAVAGYVVRSAQRYVREKFGIQR